MSKTLKRACVWCDYVDVVEVRRVVADMTPDGKVTYGRLTICGYCGEHDA